MTSHVIPKNFPALPDFPAGEVWLAGAGPGDPRLLTVLALHAIGQADDIVYDALVDRRVLDLSRDGAELISAGGIADARPEVRVSTTDCATSGRVSSWPSAAAAAAKEGTPGVTV